MLRRVIIALVFAIALSAGPHAHAAIAEDAGTPAVQVVTSGTTINLALATGGTNRLLVLLISEENNSSSAGPTVASVTDNSGTTNAWTQAMGHSNVGNDGSITSSMDFEIWWTCAPSTITAKTITVTFSGGSVGLDVAQATILAYTGQGCSTANYETVNSSIVEYASGANLTRTLTTQSTTVMPLAFASSTMNTSPPNNFFCVGSSNSYGGDGTNVGILRRLEYDIASTSGFSNRQMGWCTAQGGSTPATAGANGVYIALLTLCNPCVGGGTGGLMLQGCCAQRKEDYPLVPVAYRREQ